MALLIERNLNEPKTHVLIIAIGGYPFLRGGAKQIQQKFDGAQHLGQLSSPPISAEAFYNTILELENKNAWIKPLGSMEVLFSNPPNSKEVFKGLQPDPATRSNIKEAYRRWKARCNQDPANVAIFYFCGHGLDKGEHYLLAEDFGEDPDNPWEGAFAFDLTRRAFFACKAQTQVFFVDACRKLTSDMLKTDLPLNPLEPPSLLAKHCTYNLTQKAAADNESAYGKKNQVSFYTKALINALTNKAANNDTNEWKVSTGTIASEMNRYLREEDPAQDYPQRCISVTSDTTDILKLPPPIVPLTLSCDPDLALKLATLACIDPNSNDQFTRAPEPQPWKLDLKAGIYRIQANFKNGEFMESFEYINIKPPSVQRKLNCSK